MKPPDSSNEDRFLSLQEKLLRPKLGLQTLGTTATLILIGLGYIVEGCPGSWPFAGYAAPLALGVCSVAIISTLTVYGILRHQQIGPILHDLSKMDDPRIVELFLRLTKSNSDYWLPRVRPTLIRLLPNLHRSDATLFRSTAQAELHRLLNSSDTDLVCAVLQALPQIGTIGALPHVVPHAEGTTFASQDPWVQETAQECRAVLARRADKVKGPDMTLLRASSAPVTEQTLLRAVLSGGCETASDQLLRAHQQSPPS